MTSDELRAVVGGNIKTYRVMNNLSQMALAEKANLSVGYLHFLETGEKWGTPETIVKLAKSLNVKPFQFFMHDEAKSDSISSDLILLSNALKQNIDETISDLLKKYN
ncbi:MAG: helix-turn-helix transcriptional regulator [Treponema sp.]|nr:helix-turn-helix transcriptional regulator [Treponema sp.]